MYKVKRFSQFIGNDPKGIATKMLEMEGRPGLNGKPTSYNPIKKDILKYTSEHGEKKLVGNLSKASKLGKYGKAAMIAGGLGLSGIGAKMIYDKTNN